MPQFTKRRDEPMNPKAYRIAANRFRDMANDLDKRAEDSHERISSILGAIVRYANHTWKRHTNSKGD
jgi:hypothetical protein